MRWFVDGNNVMGSRPDGWWNDPAAAKARLTQEIAEWCRTHDDRVVVVFDRPVAPAAEQLAGGSLTVEFAPRSGRDAADHHIVTLVEVALTDEAEQTAEAHEADDTAEGTHGSNGSADQSADEEADDTAPDDAPGPGLIVVTADRGLIERLPPGVATLGPGRFRDRIAEHRERRQ
ncbi:MAG: hypothetical protein ACE367_15925 [Acidimicrobiales bacterium]